jgi:hypothetical protein
MVVVVVALNASNQPKSHMKNRCHMIVLAVIGLLSFGATTQGQIDYSSTTNSAIYFDGAGRFVFNPGVNSFQITSGTAAGLFGEVTGIYTIGTIATSDTGSTASVTGTGTLVIFDGSYNLTATLEWTDIQQMGTGDSLNVNGAVNITGVTYQGTNPDLQALATAGSGSNVLSFHFNPALSLSALSGGSGPNQASFSGTIASTTPDPTPTPTP